MDAFAPREFETLSLEATQHDIAVLRLNRPDRLNAQTATMFAEYGAAAEALRDSGARAVVLAGAGTRAFCAGFDLDEIGELFEYGVRDFLRFQETATHGIDAIRSLPMPVIAAVHGAAVGGGLALALAADLRIAGPSAVFSAAFVRIGLSFGELGTSYQLARLVGPGVAAEIGYTGRRIGAEEALRIGLATMLVDEEEVLPAALATAERIAAQPADAIRLAKRTLQRAIEVPSFEAALEFEAQARALLATAGARAEQGSGTEPWT